MISLGLESTAHTFGAAVANSKKILSNEKDSYTTKSGGIIPIEAAKHHEKIHKEVIQKALDNAKVSLKDIDFVSYSAAPGLGPCLRVSQNIVRELKLPFVEVNHCVAHLEVGKFLTKAKDPVLLYASGANTQIIAFEGGKYRIFGETLDQGVGNFIDSFARYIGLGFPGGPKIAKLADKGKEYIKLPYVVKGMDVSFTGMLTNLKQKYDSKKYKIEDLCYSLQETTFAMLLEVSERAMAHCNKTELLMGGGVACNTILQEKSNIMCKERGAKFFPIEKQYLLDNAAMIATTGISMVKACYKLKTKDPKIYPYQRTDQVKIF
ncbi:MAG: tRNA (adenosine(37)-N6)-threonylcarbamoyltransferase complex transferase subunit TsaD [Nanoarchaeota archaeon]|nr:tRNA (adenosine(37)-N6)-threonylcarbamoyltransferase complex transferase subunit TsaD [Nanoarchaeota archaeon]